MRFTKFFSATAVAAAVIAGTSATAGAQYGPGDPGVFTTSGNMTVTFVSRSAGWTHTLSAFVDPTGPSMPSGTQETLFTIDNGGATPVGPTYGVAGASGSNIVFGIYVQGDGMNNWFFSNGESLLSAGADPLYAQSIKFYAVQQSTYTTRLYIEDYPNKNYSTFPCRITGPSAPGVCAEPDFNDLVVDITNTPEPASLALLGTGLVAMGGIGALRRRKAVKA